MSHQRARLPGSPATKRRWWWWRCSALVLALLLAGLGFESAVHSVHHLLDADAGDTCALSSWAEDVPGASMTLHDAGTLLPTTEPLPAARAGRIHPLAAFDAREVRAPPAAPSA